MQDLAALLLDEARDAQEWFRCRACDVVAASRPHGTGARLSREPASAIDEGSGIL